MTGQTVNAKITKQIQDQFPRSVIQNVQIMGRIVTFSVDGQEWYEGQAWYAKLTPSLTQIKKNSWRVDVTD